jgi:methionyl-tRNA formyltransferase
MRVLFLGNHTVGVLAVDSIAETDEVVGVVAHPEDPEDGVRYLSLYDHAIARGWRTVRLRGKDPALAVLIRDLAPDLLWVTDYRYLIPQVCLDMAPLGAVNLHPSLLPQYRGRAPINWAILNGEDTFGLTAHYIDKGVDTGDIIHQLAFSLQSNQDVEDALEILYPLYVEITKKVLCHFRSGRIPRIQQKGADEIVWPARRPIDGLIDWNQTTKHVHDLIRAVTRPYPGAFTYSGAAKVIIWKSMIEQDRQNATPGEIVDYGDGQGLRVGCADGLLHILDYSYEADGRLPKIEGVLSSVPI